MAEKKEPKPGLITKAWKITIPNSTYMGRLKCVQFFNGVGCLCGYGMASLNPENYVSEEPNFRQVKGAPIDEYARYFGDRGFAVEEITVEEGLKLYQKIDRETRDYVPPVLGARPEEIAPAPDPVKATPEKKEQPTEAKEASAREVLPHENPHRQMGKARHK